MSEITGVIAKIKMTEQAKSKMYQEIGKELLTDYLFIQKAFKNQRAYYTEMDKIAEIQGGDNPMSMNDYITTNIPCTLSVPDTTENFRLMLWSLNEK